MPVKPRSNIANSFRIAIIKMSGGAKYLHAVDLRVFCLSQMRCRESVRDPTIGAQESPAGMVCHSFLVLVTGFGFSNPVPRLGAVDPPRQADPQYADRFQLHSLRR